MKAYILTTDRYWPWNGQHTHRADRIWNNLDQLLGIPFLVYAGKINKDEIEQHGEFEIVEKGITIKAIYFFLLIILKSYFLCFVKRNKRFLLGSLKIYRRKALVWYWSYAKLREYLSEHEVDLLIYHGELNAWGLSVSWACRDVGVKAVAWQHGVLTKGFVQYKLSEHDRYLPLP